MLDFFIMLVLDLILFAAGIRAGVLLERIASRPMSKETFDAIQAAPRWQRWIVSLLRNDGPPWSR